MKRAWIVLAVSVLAAQAGHLLAYQIRFGAAAQQVQSSGIHSYFPNAVRGSLGITAALALTALFLIGLARVLSGLSIRPGSAPQYARLVATLFTVQLLFFAAQEMSEAWVGGTKVASVADLLLWGTLGQLPVTLIAAAGLRWLLARFESAVHVALVRNPADRNRLRVPAAGASLAKRGPPSSLRFSSN
jgi:hypothetical protein